MAAAHPWLGPLLGDSETAALFAPEADLARMLRIEAAWTRIIAPGDVGERVARKIAGAGIAPADLAAGTARDGVPVPALVALLKSGVAEDDRRWVHRGLTSQDVIDSALVLALQEAMPVIAARLSALLAALDVLAARDGARALMGVTRMQPALPISARARIASWRRPLAGLAEQLPKTAQAAALLQWGGPVGQRDPSLPADTGPRFAAALGLCDPGHAWHAERGPLADIAALLSRLSGATGKIGQDIALMAQCSPDTLSLAAGGGSSAMPHKQNPVLAELLVTLARHNAGALAQMHAALVHEQERSGAAWMLEWLTLPGMAEATARSLGAATALIGQIVRIGGAD
jgi:3-carboxy-cis,cis-muconate cycloisomerase